MLSSTAEEIDRFSTPSERWLTVMGIFPGWTRMLKSAVFAGAIVRLVRDMIVVAICKFSFSVFYVRKKLFTSNDRFFLVSDVTMKKLF